MSIIKPRDPLFKPRVMFFFRIKGDDCADLRIIRKSSSCVQFMERTLDVAKVQAESWCRTHNFNAFINYEAFTDDSGMVVLHGIPMQVEKINRAKEALKIGKNIGKDIGQKIGKTFKKLW